MIYFHIYSDIYVNTETVSRKKEKGDYQRFTLNPGNKGTKLNKKWTGGCVRLELNNIFNKLQSSFLFLNNIVYSKCEHMSYSPSVGKV
jgi:hypothetical protein